MTAVPWQRVAGNQRWLEARFCGQARWPLAGNKVTCLWCFAFVRMDGIVAGRVVGYGLLDGTGEPCPAWARPVCAGEEVRSCWHVVRNQEVGRRPAAAGEKK